MTTVQIRVLRRFVIGVALIVFTILIVQMLTRNNEQKPATPTNITTKVLK